MQQHKVTVTNTFDYFVICRPASQEFKNCKEKWYFAPESPSKCAIRRWKISNVDTSTNPTPPPSALSLIQFSRLWRSCKYGPPSSQNLVTPMASPRKQMDFNSLSWRNPLARSQCYSSENVLKLTYTMYGSKNIFRLRRAFVSSPTDNSWLRSLNTSIYYCIIVVILLRP